jgi:ParB family transcriptional regulator, chromosome partitioning protein
MMGLSAKDTECIVPVACLGELLGGLRLRETAALEAMRRSLSRHGQLTPLVVFVDSERSEGLEILDGFKRMHAARALGWSELRAKRSEVGVTDAKVQIALLHDGRGLTEIEEAWLVRSLYRDDGLSQPEIALRLGRHKSWVCRRLVLVEALDPAVQAEVRLGLLAPRAASALAQLPRGNQRAASAVVTRRGLTVRQTELLVAQLLERPDEAQRAQWIARALEAGPGTADPAPRRAKRSEADWMAQDVAMLLRLAARLQARLLATPLGALGAPAAEVVLDGLLALAPVLTALGRTVDSVSGKERAA